MLVRIPGFRDIPISELLYGDDLGLVRCCFPSALGSPSWLFDKSRVWEFSG